jgi:4-amino-4-deoxy-L-arabinose transferase-like glycosyltransferase
MSRRTFVCLWLVAWLARLVPAVVFLNYPIALSDMLQYDMLAHSLVDGRGYRWYAAADIELYRPYLSQFMDLAALHVPAEGLPTTFRAPGYPLFLAGVYYLAGAGSRIAGARLAQTALLALLAPLAAALALKMGLSRRAAITAGLAAAFYPMLLLYPVGLASENLFIPLILLSLLALIWAGERAGLLPSLLAGLLLGLAMLTRSIVAPFAILGGIWLWRSGRSGKRGALVFLMAAFALCLPWAVRNTQVMGQPAFVESSLGYNLYVGYHPGGNGGFVEDVAVLPLTIVDDAERDRFCSQSALEFIRADPGQALWRVVRRAVFFVAVEDRELSYFYASNFFGHIQQPWLTLIYLVLVLPWIATALLAPLGMVVAPRRPVAWLAIALIAGYALPHLLVMAEPRFHLALVPVLLPFAAGAWCERRRAFAWLLSRHTARLVRPWSVRIALGTLAGLWVWGLGANASRLAALLGPDGNRLYLPY